MHTHFCHKRICLRSTCASSAFQSAQRRKRFNLCPLVHLVEFATGICTGNKCCDYAWRVCVCVELDHCASTSTMTMLTLMHVWVTALEAEPGLPPRSCQDGSVASLMCGERGRVQETPEKFPACLAVACVMAAVSEGTLDWSVQRFHSGGRLLQWALGSARVARLLGRGAPYRVTEAMWLFCMTCNHSNNS